MYFSSSHLLYKSLNSDWVLERVMDFTYLSVFWIGIYLFIIQVLCLGAFFSLSMYICWVWIIRVQDKPDFESLSLPSNVNLIELKASCRWAYRWKRSHLLPKRLCTLAILLQVVKAIQGLIPTPISPQDPRMQELQELEKQKAVIDKKATTYVKRELYCGLAYLVVQTAAFMRLTFWELTWDVMEPICFYVTTSYFMAGYWFFLKTSKEPTFEGFFQSRFRVKQKRLIEKMKFDIKRYDELKKACWQSQKPLESNLVSFNPNWKFVILIKREQMA